MLLEIISIGLIAGVGYMLYAPKNAGTITDALNERIDNGYQYRDVTYQDTPDLMHPDVRNNTYYADSERIAYDRGVNGVPRTHVQLIPGSSEIIQLHRQDNLYL